MPYITSVEEIGFERGVKKGLQQGLQQERSLILKLLTRRLGQLPPETRSQVDTLSLEQIDLLADALFDFEAIADLTSWLQSHSE